MRVRDLTLQVGQVNSIGVSNGKPTHTSTGQIQRCRTSQAAGTDDEYTAVKDTLLAFYTQLIEQYMTRITKQLLIVYFFFSPALVSVSLVFGF
jgi:hypothetical protein